MIKKVCDLCGNDASNNYKIKVKRRWTSWHEFGWEKLDLCNDCQNIFIKLKAIQETE